MIWFKVALAFLKVAGAILDQMERRRLIDEGKRQQVLEALKASNDALDRANRARAAVDHSDGGVSDEFNRDRD